MIANAGGNGDSSGNGGAGGTSSGGNIKNLTGLSGTSQTMPSGEFNYNNCIIAKSGAKYGSSMANDIPFLCTTTSTYGTQIYSTNGYEMYGVGGNGAPGCITTTCSTTSEFGQLGAVYIQFLG